MKKIIAFAGSNHSQSVNQHLVRAAAKKLSRGLVRVIQLTDYATPLYSQDFEREYGIPETIKQLYDLLREADGFLVSSPEHNGLLPAFFKNTIDWLSRIDEQFFGDKPVLLMSASPGRGGGRTNLAILLDKLPWWGAQVVGHYSLGNFYEKFDVESESLIDPEDNDRLLDAVEKLESAVFIGAKIIEPYFQTLKKIS